MPAGATVAKRLGAKHDLILAFTPTLAALESGFDRWKRALASNGALWICWPKQASGVKTDLTENVIREVCLSAGLVDVKVCAIDATWSGLKCVYRLKDRT